VRKPEKANEETAPAPEAVGEAPADDTPVETVPEGAAVYATEEGTE